MLRKILKLITTFLGISIIITILYHLTLSGEPVIVKIPDGSTGKEIAKILHEKKLILNKDIFLFISDLTGSTKKFQSGTYKFNQKMNFLKIIYMLRKGQTLKIKITIPEGYTAEQIAELIEQKGLGKKEKFMEIVKKNKLEGYLFPETYFFEPDTTEEKIVVRMKQEFEKRFTEEFKNRAKEIGMSVHQVVTLASIIEKEAKLDKERDIISGVFHNRLKKGWLLESCATVRYALKKYKDKLTYKDIKFESPYNTYLHYGLPPGPICNPGLKSTKAALYPAKTDLMFFFTKGEGTHEFSKYYKDHIEGQKK